MADAECNGDPVDVSQRGLRIGSIFIIMAASAFGAFLPVLLARQSSMHVPKFTFFICKYFGTGVIIATAWMHLLQPAAEALGDPCLEPRLGDYPWAFAIGLMTVMVMFLVEMVASSFSGDDGAHSHGSASDNEMDPAMEVLAVKSPQRSNNGVSEEPCAHADDVERQGAFRGPDQTKIPGLPDDVSYPPGGQDHLAHGRDHKEGDSHNDLAGQLTSIFILEFGVVFHSVFIGLTLGTTNEVVILLIVLVFHQMFEGLGLGSRLALASWPSDKKWLPFLLGGLFAVATPLGIAAGVAAQPNNSNDQKLINGIFDAISSGILMYTGLVELLAHEFMFNPHMRSAPLKIQLFAFGCVALGVALMALLAKWA